ncbi:MAG TPA: ABC transporter ATP-binding protein [Rectinemataceae bacterium]|nr:ABC transporter ATP-binding protein [Rectinemataceae bacterium]
MAHEGGHPSEHGRDIKYESKASLGEFISLVAGTKPSIPSLAVALGLSLVSTAGGLVVPLLTKGVVNGLSSQSLASLDFGKALLIGLAFLLQAGGGALSSYLLARIGQGVVASLRERLWRKQLVLPVSYFDRYGSGPLVSRMTNDTAVVKNFITENMTSLVSGAISAVGAIFFLFYLDWKMSLLMLAAIPLAVLAILPLGKTMMKVARKTMDENAVLTSILARVLSEIRLVKASNAEEREFREGKGAIDRLYSFGVKEGTVNSLVGPLMSLILMALLVLVVGYGGARVASGALSAGDLVAFILYLIQVVVPVTMLTNAVNQLQKARGATQSIVELLGEKEEQRGGISPSPVRGALSFRDLSFSYRPGEPVIRHLDFELEPGTVAAIVGPSGAGKTTLFALLERFYEADSGAILLDGLPLCDWAPEALRSQLGYVPQDSPLMSGSIRDNLVYGVPRAPTEAEIREAARIAYAEAFIEALPRGYDTEVGERGVKLSGGQRQRIAIARAVLRDPAILMLDEATSSLDSEAEEQVQHAMQNLMKGRTTLVIAHRLSTVVDADRILFLEAGELTGTGRHEELLESHALYRSFALRQFRLDPAALAPV